MRTHFRHLAVLPIFALAAACSESPNPHGPWPVGYHQPLASPETLQRRQEVEAENSTKVTDALSKMTEGQKIGVRGVVDSQCSGTMSAYTLERLKGELHLNLKLELKLYPGANDFPALYEKVLACIPPVEKFWGRYGFKFHLQLLEAPVKNPDYTIYLDSKIDERSWAYHWYPNTTWSDYCTMMLHEIGHLVGLPDEYAESGTCRDEEHVSREESPWSLMNQHYMGFENVELFARHLDVVLGPILDEAEARPKKVVVARPFEVHDLHGQYDVTVRDYPSLKEFPHGQEPALAQGHCQLFFSTQQGGFSASTGKTFSLDSGESSYGYTPRGTNGRRSEFSWMGVPEGNTIQLSNIRCRVSNGLAEIQSVLRPELELM